MKFTHIDRNVQQESWSRTSYQPQPHYRLLAGATNNKDGDWLNAGRSCMAAARPGKAATIVQIVSIPGLLTLERVSRKRFLPKKSKDVIKQVIVDEQRLWRLSGNNDIHTENENKEGEDKCQKMQRLDPDSPRSERADDLTEPDGRGHQRIFNFESQFGDREEAVFKMTF